MYYFISQMKEALDWDLLRQFRHTHYIGLKFSELFTADPIQREAAVGGS